MATNKCDIQEEEILLIEVGNFPSLYVKRFKGYKETGQKKNAGCEIDKTLGYEDGVNKYIYVSFRISLTVCFPIRYVNDGIGSRKVVVEI